MFKSRLCVSVC